MKRKHFASVLCGVAAIGLLALGAQAGGAQSSKVEDSDWWSDPQPTYNASGPAIYVEPSPEPTAEVIPDGKITEDDGTEAKSTDLKIHFVDVSHGDCIVIEKNGKFILVDAGHFYRYNQSTESYTGANMGYVATNYLKKLGCTKLEAVIATHPHADHIYGMNNVLKTYPCELIFMPDVPEKTFAADKTHPAYENLLSRIDTEGVAVCYPNVGDTYTFEDIKFTFLAPKSKNYSDVNDFSIVTRLTYGKTSILLTGDALKTSEKQMIDSKNTLSSTVLKVPHHSIAGETQSATDHKAFIQKVKAKYSVITNNTLCSNYVLNWLTDYGDVFGTFDKRNIVLTTDGTNLTFNCKPQYYAKETIKTKVGKKAGPSVVSQSATEEYNPTKYYKKSVSLQFTASSPSHTFKKLEYQLVKRGAKMKASGWKTLKFGKKLTIKKNFVGRVYVRYTRDDSSTVIYKTKLFCVEKKLPKSPKIKATGISGIKTLTTGKSTSYSNTTYNKVTLSFSIKWGVSGKKAIHYQLVPKGKKYNSKKGWKKGSKVTINKYFQGCVYVRYKSKAGNYVYRKTSGFTVIR